MSSNGKFAWLAGTLLGGLLLGWLVSEWFIGTSPSATVSEAPSGGDFSLTTPNGAFRLADQRGKVVLIYIGYSFCPDICPTNLALMTQALNALSEVELERVQGLFLSVDPERDTMERLQNYTGYFHSAILGATADQRELERIAERYGAFYRRVEGESAGGYLMDHSSITYVIAPDGSLHAMLPHAAPPEDILTVTRKLLTRFPQDS